MQGARTRPIDRSYSETSRNNGPKIVAAIVGLAALAGVGWWAFSRSRPESGIVTRRTIVPTVSLAGDVTVPPDKIAYVMPPFTAPVKAVHATLGKNVRKGELIAELTAPALDQQIRDAEAALKTAEASYQSALTSAGGDVRTAKANLDAARAREKAARASMKAASAPTEITISPEGVTTTTPAPATTTAPANADLAAAQRDRIAAEADLAEAISQRDASVAPFRQAVESARANYLRAKSGARLDDVRSPIEGTITQLNATTGQNVGEDGKTPIAVVVNLDALELQANIGPEAVEEVKAGREGTLLVTEVPGEEFNARVHSIVTVPTKDGKTAYRAIVHILNEGGAVKPGMKGAVAIHLDERRDVLAVPVGAVRYDKEGRPIVSVLQGEKWMDRVVEIGLSDGTYREIRSGVREGETVKVYKKVL
jgi:RND family efflux transporter MFP subunit